jgi:hypothetical protein
MLGASSTSLNGDCIFVGLEITFAVGRSQRTFAEHVVGIAIGAIFFLLRTIQSFLDCAAHDELMAHDAHRLAHREADDRLAGAADQAFECAGDVALGLVGEGDEFAGQHQTPGAGVDEQRIALAQMRFPVGLAELVGDQFICGGLVRNPQQSLGDAHQQHAFLARQVVFAHERFDRRLFVRFRTHARNQLGCAREHQIALRRRQRGLAEHFVHALRFVAAVSRGHARVRRVGCWRKFGAQNVAHGGRTRDTVGLRSLAARETQ